MSSRFRAASAALLGLLLLTACEREERQLQGAPRPQTGPGDITLTDLYAGAPAPPPPDPRAQMYEGNAFHISQGQKYYQWYNCSGCHFNGGGGIGPALMDDVWRYGSSMEQIHATIVQGRPNGMPSFRAKIPDAQIWEIAAYVRTLSANAPKDATSARTDDMQSTTPRNQENAQRPTPSDPAAVQVPAQ
ncbi:MAG TPA: cytochrome c [Caulobacteraceae bacterium]|jgi:cytochrome c oxidase cbb3-type subunit 3